MPIESITGKPGNAKTAHLVKRILVERDKNQARIEAGHAPRPLWASGIDGFKAAECGCNVFKDPREWNAVLPGEVCTCHDTENSEACNSHVIPNGSLIFIDEAWKWFGHLHDPRGANPPHVLALAEHRHRGIDMVWTYQQPSQIFPFARGLMAEHRHLVRKFGTMFCDAYDWQELCEDVKSSAKREAAQKSLVPIPKETFGLYKSAEVHTIKRKFPLKVILLPVVLVAAAGLLWFAVNALRPKNMADRINGKSPDAAAAAAESSGGGGAAGPEVDPFSPQGLKAYADRLRPRFSSMPESAPIYDDRPAVSVPQVFCMASAPGQAADGWKDASVSCFTEQGTRYSLPTPEARTLARYGRPYDAFKEPAQPLASQTVTGPSGAAPVGALGLGWSSGAIPAGTGTP